MMHHEKVIRFPYETIACFSVTQVTCYIHNSHLQEYFIWITVTVRFFFLLSSKLFKIHVEGIHIHKKFILQTNHMCSMEVDIPTFMNSSTIYQNKARIWNSLHADIVHCAAVNTSNMKFYATATSVFFLFFGFFLSNTHTFIYVCVQSQTGHALAQDQRKSRITQLHKQSLKSWFRAWHANSKTTLCLSNTVHHKLINTSPSVPEEHISKGQWDILHAFSGIACIVRREG